MSSSQQESSWLPEIKPRLRGVSHQWAFIAALVSGLALVVTAPSRRAVAAAAIYAVALAGMFGASALYHRIDWRPRVSLWMRRLDHSMIFVMIAGTYTPIALLLLDGAFSRTVLGILWGGVVLGLILKLVWIGAPSWLAAFIYLALGWIGVATLPQLVRVGGVAAATLLLAGGVLYTAGAVVYARGRPNPKPAVFGFHEVFHVLVIAAAVVHFVAVAFFVIPRG
ncbi:MAG: hemolysin III family protein [Thermoleophilaceae bacterium]|nr:hemolysin III family protein [Thermoleophilaceae bacterium]